MKPGLTGIGPSMVDVCAELDQDTYEECCESLQVEPGDWKQLETPQDVRRLFAIITQNTAIEPNVQSVTPFNNISLTPGSSILGMLGALPPRLRANSHLITALASSRNREDSFAAMFRQTVEDIGIRIRGQTIEGHNPLGFVLHTPGNREKVLATYSGVASELDSYDELESIKPSQILIDAYELKEGKLSGILDEIIRSGEYRIALSLGNHALLNSGVGERVRGYIDAGLIDSICGNSLEYKALYEEIPESAVSKHEFKNHPVKDNVPHVLVTYGQDGLASHWDGRYYTSPAHPMDEHLIVNTSGAGDTAMGVFCAGIAEGSDAQETLRKAAYMATRVLQISGSMVIAEE